jgi:hypothetical protein
LLDSSHIQIRQTNIYIYKELRHVTQYIASIEGKNIIVPDTGDIASTEFNMPRVETLMEAVYQPMNMEEDDVFDDAVLICWGH